MEDGLDDEWPEFEQLGMGLTIQVPSGWTVAAEGLGANTLALLPRHRTAGLPFRLLHLP